MTWPDDVKGGLLEPYAPLDALSKLPDPTNPAKFLFKSTPLVIGKDWPFEVTWQTLPSNVEASQRASEFLISGLANPALRQALSRLESDLRSELRRRDAKKVILRDLANFTYKDAYDALKQVRPDQKTIVNHLLRETLLNFLITKRFKFKREVALQVLDAPDLLQCIVGIFVREVG